jgi:hypothetical protein
MNHGFFLVAANLFIYCCYFMIFGFENYAERKDNLGLKNAVCSKTQYSSCIIIVRTISSISQY